MKIVAAVARFLLGGMFVVFGLNYFAPFLSMPSLPAPAGEFMGALVQTGYLLPIVKAIELVAGALLLAGLLVPLALVLLAPIVVNIVLFNLFLTPASNWPMALIVLALEVLLLWAYRDYFKGLFAVKTVAR